MATEIELKFRIPPQRLAALRRAVATRSAQILPLAAAYFDTPGEHLARARTALRLRCEGEAWVQTLKAEGASPLQRLEHNAPVAGRAQPALDIGRHDGSAAGATLRRVLADVGAKQPLGERYTTTVQRTQRLLRSGGALIELALDEGAVCAGGRSLALCEIEFELLRGPTQALLDLAGRWQLRHGLLLDVRSKSELGHNLAAGLDGSPPAVAPPHATALGQVLRVVLANASQLAAGLGQPDHVLQLRLGLMQLRRMLGEGQKVSVGLGVTTRLAALDAPLATAYLVWRAVPGVQQVPADVLALLHQPATQQLWLALLALTLLPAETALHATAC